MSEIARDPALDSTFAILKDGYDFIWKRCQRLNTELFTTRVMGKKTVCIHGREAAELFYDESKFQRHGALPRRVVTSLFGQGAIHSLDDDAHRQRKAAFLSLMSPTSLQRLSDLTAAQWRTAIARWEEMRSIVLFDEVQQVLTMAVCTWAGLPLVRAEVPKRAADLIAMVDAFGGAGPRLWKGKLARMRAERWTMAQIEKVRRGEHQPATDTALYVMAHHRESNGAPLATRTAAVELLNVIRPTVAISWYIAFAALALHQHPDARARLANAPEDDAVYRDLFMQEVRRFYPFTPYLGAKVRRPFEWRGHRFQKGTLVLLDVHGTNHDPKVWQEPETFRPERFLNWQDDAFDFIPQGGGSRTDGHRCPGEWITMHSIALALHFLTRCISYEVQPEQDLSYDLARMPTRPRSGFVIGRVRSLTAIAKPAPRLPSHIAAHDAADAASRGEVGRCPVAHHPGRGQLYA
jgi:fatty-acid peroxygenase